ncbi:MAG: prepilin-type N-terminal cleavage/methylation domain-containing protein [Sedimentisphaerales bacterium]|jgi:prepilin-type N-terminal cleavage/methylation domain-containing protein
MIFNSRTKKGFTLIELMVVIFIVGILAAVAIPIMRGRVDAAKWSEAKATMGSIRTAIRSYQAEKGASYNYAGTTLTDLGFILRANGAAVSDLDGKYLTEECYAVAVTGYDVYTITCTAAKSTQAEKPTTPATEVLDDAGVFTP